MYSSLQLAKKYIHYYQKAQNGKGHGIHSPFVFQFIIDVLNNRDAHKTPNAIEELRQKLKKNKTVLQIDDLGAGSRTHHTKQRSIAQLARSAVKPKKYGTLLYRLVKKYNPATVIELGTSLGITTAYMAAAAPAAQIITIEGSHTIQAEAQKNFEKLGLKNIKSLHGNFDDLLPGLVESASAVDLVYIDGNHRYAPTIAYFHLLLSKVHHNSILIFDDIHWSAEMEQAWEEIKAHPAVRCSIDIFYLGFVFFKEEFKETQHFTIRY